MNASGVDPCAPIQQVERCADICFPDSQHNYFLSCTYNGKIYRAMTTRIKNDGRLRLRRRGLPDQRVLRHGPHPGQLRGLRALSLKRPSLE